MTHKPLDDCSTQPPSLAKPLDACDGTLEGRGSPGQVTYLADRLDAVVQHLIVEGVWLLLAPGPLEVIPGELPPPPVNDTWRLWRECREDVLGENAAKK